MTSIVVTAQVCDLDHGGKGNEATVYGHAHPNRACLRIGMTDTWVHDPREGGES